MNDRQLEARLRMLHVPERTEEYWDVFPSRVRLQLISAERTPRRQAPQWGWNSGLAFACAISVMLLVPLFNAALRGERILQRDAEKFPQNVRLLMTDEHGMQYLVADRE
jgi:hypothetical protein